MSERIPTAKTMIALTTRTIQKTETSTIPRKIAEKDKTAVKDCIDAYGTFIRAIARKFTASRGEAETATEEFSLTFGDAATARVTRNQSKKS